MKKSKLTAIGGLVLVFVCGLSYWVGKQVAEREASRFVENLMLNSLGNTLLTLRYFDLNQPDEARRLLQAETNGQLSWVISLERQHDDAETVAQRCRVFNTLKQYREKHGLFKTSEWNVLWKLPGAKEEEEKRIKFLSEMSCGADVLFKPRP